MLGQQYLHGCIAKGISRCPTPSATLTCRAPRPHGISCATPQLGISSWGNVPDTWDTPPSKACLETQCHMQHSAVALLQLGAAMQLAEPQQLGSPHRRQKRETGSGSVSLVLTAFD